jgi:peptidyl-prolyl cis-trans isomerase SurA
MKYLSSLLLLFVLATAHAEDEEQAPDISVAPLPRSGDQGGQKSPSMFTPLPESGDQSAILPEVGYAQEADARVQQYPLNRIVAIVNDDLILSSELDAAIDGVVEQLRAKDTPVPDRPVLAKQVLERLIVETLQLEIAERNGVSVDDSMINEEIKLLAEQNGITLTEFRDVLLRDGYDYSKFREGLGKQILIQQVRRQMVASRIKVTDQEIDNLMATLKASGQSDIEYQLSHILITIPEASSPEEIQAAEQHAGNILERLRSGADFSEIAIAESGGQTALEGGDIGWRKLGQIPSLFLESVEVMQVGDVSDLIRSSGGFHIIKLTGKRGDERHIIQQTKARHILLKPDTVNLEADIRIRIGKLESRIRGGEDFATLARSNSQDTLSAAKGGDLGWVNQGDTVPEFEEAMNRLEVGETSGPVKSQFGWHIIQVQERRSHDSTEEYERSKVRNLIRSRKYDEELFLWLRRLRDESYVEYRLDES